MRAVMILALLFLSSPAFAQSDDDALRTYNGVACGMFEKTPEGYWRAKTWVLLWCGVQFPRKTLVLPGGLYCGRDLAADLDDACGE